MVDLYLGLMVDGLLKSLVLPGSREEYPTGALLGGCFKHPKSYATNSELIWGTAYLLFTLHYLKSGRVSE